MVLDAKRVVSVAEFEAFVDLPENADKCFELIGGEIVEKVPSNAYVSEIAINIAFAIKLYLQAHAVEGHVTGEQGGYKVLDQRYAPDVAFVSKSRQARLDTKGYNSVAPDLAVEIISENDSEWLLTIKVGNYLAAGTTVWVVCPDVKRVAVYAPNQAVKDLGVGDVLEGGAVLPNFQLAVKDIFPE